MTEIEPMLQDIPTYLGSRPSVVPSSFDIAIVPSLPALNITRASCEKSIEVVPPSACGRDEDTSPSFRQSPESEWT